MLSPLAAISRRVAHGFSRGGREFDHELAFLHHSPVTLPLLLTLLAAAPAGAWHGNGHHRATVLAVKALPNDLPAFFRDGTPTIAHCSLDPDLFTRPIAPEALHKAESPEHYIDLEILKGAPLPPLRYDLLAWCAKNDVKPYKLGLLPYAVVESTQRLAVCFAEYRKWPHNPAVKTKTLVYAGLLAHYAEDLTMPLHTTIHYNGRVKPGRAPAKTGIHQNVDALLGKLPKDVRIHLDPTALKPFSGDLFTAVLAELNASHALVDKVYDLEAAGAIPAYESPLDPTGPAADFARDRLRAAAAFTARLFLTAWQDSAKITLPDWHKRPAD
ncbi:MAG: hypothetical protein JXQ73_32110 [Phycisphaerae bacterium]|nr:hypothetical protein [Phycisphaerae bacterium]